MTHQKQNKRILFVCLGNICRSAAAEGIARQMAEEEGRTDLVFDSAGLYGGHAGQQPDRRMIQHARKRGYDLTPLRARQVRMSDFDNFDLIVAMDDSNYQQLRRMAPTAEDERKIVRMASYLTSFPGYDYVPDPYYEGAEGFELVLDMLEEGILNLVNN